MPGPAAPVIDGTAGTSEQPGGAIVADDTASPGTDVPDRRPGATCDHPVRSGLPEALVGHVGAGRSATAHPSASSRLVLRNGVIFQIYRLDSGSIRVIGNQWLSFSRTSNTWMIRSKFR